MNDLRNGKNCPPRLYPFGNELFHEKFEIYLRKPPTNFSYAYFKLAQVHQSVKEERLSSLGQKDKKTKIPESFICSLWMDQAFKSKYLFTLDNKRIEIIFPGQWNFEKGPDFKNARFKMERGEIVKGDVEIHHHSSDWISHKHHLNTEYNNVVLHVFLWKNKGAVEQKKANGQPILQLEIRKFLIKDIMELYSLMKSEDYSFNRANNLGHCAEFLKKADEKRLILFLNLAGEARLLSKANRFYKKAQNKNYNQLLYEGLMESLGFKYSKLQFLHIAEIAPLHYLREKLKFLSSQEKAKHIESIFFGIAGFLDYFKGTMTGLDKETILYFKELSQTWRLYKNDFITKKLHFSHWNFSGVRPANLPYGRLAGMSAFLSENMDKHLISTIYPAISGLMEGGPTNKKLEEMSNLFSASSNGFWEYRYSPLGKRLSKPKKLIGKNRILDIIVNVFLPVMLSFTKEHKWQSMKKLIYKIYETFPRLSPNRITKFMEEFILGLIENKKHILSKAKHQQALHQIYSDYCEPNKEECDNCRFYFIAKYLILGHKVPE